MAKPATRDRSTGWVSLPLFLSQCFNTMHINENDKEANGNVEVFFVHFILRTTEDFSAI